MALAELATSGAGVALLPISMFESYIAQGRLAQPFVVTFSFLLYYLVCSSYLSATSAMSTFSRWLTGQSAEYASNSCPPPPSLPCALSAADIGRHPLGCPSCNMKPKTDTKGSKGLEAELRRHSLLPPKRVGSAQQRRPFRDVRPKRGEGPLPALHISQSKRSVDFPATG